MLYPPSHAHTDGTTPCGGERLPQSYYTASVANLKTISDRSTPCMHAVYVMSSCNFHICSLCTLCHCVLFHSLLRCALFLQRTVFCSHQILSSQCGSLPSLRDKQATVHQINRQHLDCTLKCCVVLFDFPSLSGIDASGIDASALCNTSLSYVCHHHHQHHCMYLFPSAIGHLPRM